MSCGEALWATEGVATKCGLCWGMPGSPPLLSFPGSPDRLAHTCIQSCIPAPGILQITRVHARRSHAHAHTPGAAGLQDGSSCFSHVSPSD